MIAMRSGFGSLVQFQPNSIAVSVLHYPSDKVMRLGYERQLRANNGSQSKLAARRAKPQSRKKRAIQSYAERLDSDGSELRPK
jgi:hypothetical protein